MARQLAFVYGAESLARVAAAMIHELVVQHPVQPRPRVAQIREFVEAAEYLRQYVLEQVFGFRLVMRQPIREAVEPLHVRLQQALEQRRLIVFVGAHASTAV